MLRVLGSVLTLIALTPIASCKSKAPLTGGQVASPQSSSTQPAAVPCSSPSDYLGPRWGADQLANLEIGKDGQQVSYRFVALASRPAQSVRIYLKRGDGYSRGDGGRILVTLQTDDGTNAHTPSGHVLGSATVNGYDDEFPLVRFDHAGPLQARALYHLVFTNIAEHPRENFVSINDIESSDMAAASPVGWAVLSKFENSNWTLHPKHVPIFALSYEDGCSQGQGVIDALSESGIFVVNKDKRARQAISITGPAITVSSIAVRGRKLGNSEGALNARLEDSNGRVLANADLQPSASPEGYRWSRASFPPVTLTSGATYYVTLSSSAPYQIFPVQTGEERGFATPDSFHGEFQVSNGNGWTSRGNNLVMQLHLTIKRDTERTSR